MSESHRPLSPEELESALAAPFDRADVKFRPGATSGNRAMALGYIDARAVQDRLDKVVGVTGWQDEYECLPDDSVVCRLRVKFGAEWVTKMDVGSPSEQPDEHDRRKAAFSDALKRAAVKFGIGRYLYRLPVQWVDFDPKKRQFTATPSLPAEALPRRPATAAALPQKAPSAPQKAAPPAQPARQPAPPADAAQRTPGPQKKAETIAEALARKDAAFTRDGVCSPGQLLAYALEHGHAQGLPAALADWKGPDHIALAARLVQQFLDAPLDAGQHAELRRLLAEAGVDAAAFCGEAQVRDTNYLPRKDWPAARSKLATLAQDRRRAARTAG